MSADQIVTPTARLWAMRALFVLAGLALVAVAYCSGERKQSASDAIAASKQVTAAAQVVRAAAIETVTVRNRIVVHDSALAVRADSALAVSETSRKRADSLAVVIDSIHVRVRDTVAVVPAEIVSRLVVDSIDLAKFRQSKSADSALVGSLRGELVADRTVMRADSVIQGSMQHTIDLMGAQHAPRCGAKCGAVVATVTIVGGAFVWAHVIH